MVPNGSPLEILSVNTQKIEKKTRDRREKPERKKEKPQPQFEAIWKLFWAYLSHSVSDQGKVKS